MRAAALLTRASGAELAPPRAGPGVRARAGAGATRDGDDDARAWQARLREEFNFNDAGDRTPVFMAEWREPSWCTGDHPPSLFREPLAVWANGIAYRPSQLADTVGSLRKEGAPQEGRAYEALYKHCVFLRGLASALAGVEWRSEADYPCVPCLVLLQEPLATGALSALSKALGVSDALTGACRDGDDPVARSIADAAELRGLLAKRTNATSHQADMIAFRLWPELRNLTYLHVGVGWVNPNIVAVMGETQWGGAAGFLTASDDTG